MLRWTLHLYVTFPDYDISLLSNCTCQSKYHYTSLRRHMQELSNRPSTGVFDIRRSEHPALFPSATLIGVSV